MTSSRLLHQVVALGVVVAGWLWEASPADAQIVNVRSTPYNTVRNPTVSPYLNLFNNGGRNVGLNYYNQVRPQIDLRAATGRLQSDMQSLQTGLSKRNTAAGSAEDQPISTRRMRQTGHSATFGNLQGYFPNGPGR